MPRHTTALQTPSQQDDLFDTLTSIDDIKAVLDTQLNAQLKYEEGNAQRASTARMRELAKTLDKANQALQDIIRAQHTLSADMRRLVTNAWSSRREPAHHLLDTGVKSR